MKIWQKLQFLCAHCGDRIPTWPRHSIGHSPRTLISHLVRLVILMVGVAGCMAQNPTMKTDRQAMEMTGASIRAAFAKSDLEVIASYHHPKVEKALSYSKYLKGRDAVIADLRLTLEAYTLTFVEHQIESLEFFGDTCVEQTRFTIRGESKGDAPPFTFRGRAMVVYIRYSNSPSGWASIREVIQPATD